MSKAKRYNAGKLRYELIAHEALKEIAKVYTYGAHKYSTYQDEHGKIIEGVDISIDEASKRQLKIIDDGANNWRKGQSWTQAIASVERHIQAWKWGEDYDELGTLHLSNAAWGLMQLLTYYRTHPHLDDREPSYLKLGKVGLDIDDVLCGWADGWIERFDLHVPSSWYFDRRIEERIDELRNNDELNDFYLSLKPIVDPNDIPFEPHCYVTSRPVNSEVSEQWLDKYKFSCRPVYTVPMNTTKVEVLIEIGVDTFVDDRYQNFVEINKAGINCYLYDRPHNRRYDVGHKRIYKLSDLITGDHLNPRNDSKSSLLSNLR